MKAITVVLISFFLVRLMFGQVPLIDRGWWVDATAGFGLVAILVIHGRAVWGVVRRRQEQSKAEPRFRWGPQGPQLISDRDFDLQRNFLGDSKWVDWISRHSKIVLVRCGPRLIIAWLLFLLSVYWLVAHPWFYFTTWHIDLSKVVPGAWDIKPYHGRVSLWWIPVPFALRQLYKAAGMQQHWKWHPIWIVDDVHLIERHQESALFPEEKRKDIRIPLEQIVEVDSEVDYWGGLLGGYGSLFYKRSLTDQKDDEKEYEIPYMPRVEELVRILRAHPNCPAGRTKDEKDQAARIP
jgi:hypothetical protein